MVTYFFIFLTLECYCSIVRCFVLLLHGISNGRKAFVAREYVNSGQSKGGVVESIFMNLLLVGGGCAYHMKTKTDMPGISGFFLRVHLTVVGKEMNKGFIRE